MNNEIVKSNASLDNLDKKLRIQLFQKCQLILDHSSNIEVALKQLVEHECNEILSSVFSQYPDPLLFYAELSTNLKKNQSRFPIITQNWPLIERIILPVFLIGISAIFGNLMLGFYQERSYENNKKFEEKVRLTTLTIEQSNTLRRRFVEVVTKINLLESTSIFHDDQSKELTSINEGIFDLKVYITALGLNNKDLDESLTLANTELVNYITCLNQYSGDAVGKKEKFNCSTNVNRSILDRVAYLLAKSMNDSIFHPEKGKKESMN